LAASSTGMYCLIGKSDFEASCSAKAALTASDISFFYSDGVILISFSIECLL
jgi:hypothetical protein